MEADLFYLVVVGHETTIVNVMSKKKSKDAKVEQAKLKQILELLKFALTLDDEEIMKSTIESVVELLEEEISK